LRHTAATWMEEGKIPMTEISKMLGHRDTKTTEKIYAHPSAEYLREASNLIDLKIAKRGRQRSMGSK
jgi:integrase